MKLKRLLRRVGLLKDGVSMTETTLRVTQQYSYSHVDPILLKHFREEIIHNLNLYFDNKGRLMCRDESTDEVISLTKENVQSQTTGIVTSQILETGLLDLFIVPLILTYFRSKVLLM